MAEAAKISEASQRVIDKMEATFSKSIIILGSNKISANFPRSTIDKALWGNYKTIAEITEHAVEKKWIKKGDTRSIKSALEYIRLTRTVTAS